MKKIKKALKEIDSSFRKVDLFLVVIKTLLLLSFTYLFLSIISITSFYAFIPAVVYFISSLFVELRKDNVKRIEKHYDILDEKLKTARDYQDQDNLVLDRLEGEIIKDLKHVKLSSFLISKFSFRKMFDNPYLVVFLLILSVGSSLYLASEEIRIVDFNEVVKDAMKLFEDQQNETIEEVDFTGTEESIMTVGDERVEVEISPVGLDFDFNDVREEGDYDFSTSFPKDVFISSGAAYENEFTEEQQELIKRYFNKKNER